MIAHQAEGVHLRAVRISTPIPTTLCSRMVTVLPSRVRSFGGVNQ
jgi:hypothetical protein